VLIETTMVFVFNTIPGQDMTSGQLLTHRHTDTQTELYALNCFQHYLINVFKTTSWTRKKRTFLIYRTDATFKRKLKRISFSLNVFGVSENKRNVAVSMS